MSKTLFVIHHSHTDVGYTAHQAVIRRRHVAFIRQALSILEQRGMDCGFRWTVESFWAVEQFMSDAREDEVELFAHAVLSGAIGLSANYLNLSELACDDLLRELAQRAVAFGKRAGVPVDSAMTADINGFGWGYGRALADSDVQNLFTCIHTHHGAVPFERHYPFWWVLPGGKRILVWHGEHYHFGNELGLVPGAVSSYITKDECDARMIYHEPWQVAEIRIPRLFDQLDKRGYPYDFLPVMASGLRTDNGPPSVDMLDQIHRWNDAHGDEIHVEMVTLSQFFASARQRMGSIEEHQGDWPDWWTDGTASMPVSTALFRTAQRRWRVARSLHRGEAHGGASLPPALERQLVDNLALYAEHTYGHAASVVEPFDPMVSALHERKAAYAALADELSVDLLERALTEQGAASLSPGMPLRYRVINPTACTLTAAAELNIEHHEYYEHRVYQGIQVIDEANGQEVDASVKPTPVTTSILVPLTLRPGEERTFSIQSSHLRDLSPDEGRPMLRWRELEQRKGVFVSDEFEVHWSIPEGITAWMDRATGKDLLRPDREHNAFIPVRSVTPMTSPDDAWSVRGEMGLNRSGMDAFWSAGKVMAARERESGATLGDPTAWDADNKKHAKSRWLEFDLELDGSFDSTLVLKSIAGVPGVEVEFNTNKQNTWDPENLYLSLPFGSSREDTVWLDKPGAPVRARVDQLPGSLIDFYAVQDGFVVAGEHGLTGVAMPDNPLLQLGPLEAMEPRPVHNPMQRHPDKALPYAWLMSNYWETNFAAGLGGFHRFRFSVFCAAASDIADALSRCRAVNTGFISYRVGQQD